jgi:hypothetical protein
MQQSRAISNQQSISNQQRTCAPDAPAASLDRLGSSFDFCLYAYFLFSNCRMLLSRPPQIDDIYAISNSFGFNFAYSILFTENLGWTFE